MLVNVVVALFSLVVVVTCLGEPPGVAVSGPTSVPYGQDVELVCIPTAGRPLPDLEYKPGVNEVGLPPNSVSTPQGDSLLLQVTNLREKFCIDCVGTNLEGEISENHCVDVIRKYRLLTAWQKV